MVGFKQEVEKRLDEFCGEVFIYRIGDDEEERIECNRFYLKGITSPAVFKRNCIIMFGNCKYTGRRFTIVKNQSGEPSEDKH